MKLITRETDYAIRAICFIAKSKHKIISVSVLVKELKIPRPFLRKILQVLDKNKILRSHKGLGGGFLLDKKPESIFLLDLIEIFQERFSLNECFFKKLPCPNKERCVLRRKIQKIERYVFSQLEPITVASLLK